MPQICIMFSISLHCHCELLVPVQCQSMYFKPSACYPSSPFPTPLFRDVFK